MIIPPLHALMYLDKEHEPSILSSGKVPTEEEIKELEEEIECDVIILVWMYASVFLVIVAWICLMIML